MCDKTMENYKPNMFQLQCLKALEIQIEEGKGYNEAEIGRKMQVNRSTISRCFKRYREEGFLEDKGFTRKGKEFLEYYKMIEADLYHYFASIGINEQQQRQAVTGMFDTADIDTIQKLCQKEKMHLKYESIGKNESKEITKMTYEQLCSSLKKGIYQVAFSIYRQGKDWQSLSMADQGFEKPASPPARGGRNGRGVRLAFLSVGGCAGVFHHGLRHRSGQSRTGDRIRPSGGGPRRRGGQTVGLAAGTADRNRTGAARNARLRHRVPAPPRQPGPRTRRRA